MSELSILNERPKAGMEAFFRTVSPYLTQYDSNTLADVASNIIKGSANPLEKSWYESVKRGNPDYSIYASELYIPEAWACWIAYSRKYIKWIQKTLNPADKSYGPIFQGVRGVADLGCGFGYTTAALKEVFPDARVSGTQMEGTLQSRLAKNTGKVKGFDVVGSADRIAHPVDLVFASEYFEHFLNPVEHANETLKALGLPRTLVIANTFSSPSTGHFPSYQINGQTVPGRKTAVAFNKSLKSLGYKAIKTNAWNNRPRVWRR